MTLVDTQLLIVHYLSKNCLEIKSNKNKKKVIFYYSDRISNRFKSQSQAKLWPSVKYLNKIFRAPFTSLSISKSQDSHLNVFDPPRLFFMNPQFPHVFDVYSSVHSMTLQPLNSRDLWCKNIRDLKCDQVSIAQAVFDRIFLLFFKTILEDSNLGNKIITSLNIAIWQADDYTHQSNCEFVVFFLLLVLPKARSLSLPRYFFGTIVPKWN